MAITTITSPQVINPVYNPFYYVVSSSNSTQPNFKFIFDVYDSMNTGSTYVSRLPLPARPNTNNCIFSPARVLESYISYDLPNNIVISASSTNCFSPIMVRVGEQYGSSTTGVTNYPNLKTYTGYTFGGVLTYQQLPSWNFVPYTFPLSSSTRWLTNSPTPKLIRSGERETLSMIFSGDNVPYIALNLTVKVYHNSGTTTTQLINAASLVTPGASLNTFGVGPWNLTQIYPTLINYNTDYKYDVYISGFVDQPPSSILTEVKTYQLDMRCTKYTPIRFMFLNRFGVFDYFTAILLSREFINVEKKTYKKVLDYNYTLGDRGFTVIDVNARESMLVNTDWVSQAESNWLKEFFTSPEVYELQTDGTILPIVLDLSNQEIKKTIDDKLIQYEFNYTYAYEYNTQRG